MHFFTHRMCGLCDLRCVYDDHDPALDPVDFSIYCASEEINCASKILKTHQSNIQNKPSTAYLKYSTKSLQNTGFLLAPI